MNSIQNIRGIIFDLDGTLYRMRWFMRPLLAIKVFPNVGRLPRFLKERGSFAGKQMGSRENLLNTIADAVSVKEKCSAEVIYNWIQESFYPSFVSLMPFFKNSRPGIDDVLIQLRKRNTKLGVLSDYDFVPQRLQLLDIDPNNFDTMTSSEAYGALKPSAHPFLQIAVSWGLAPENVLVIGDRDDTDGEGARSAGMQFLQLTDSNNGKGLSWEKVKSLLYSI